jgi:opacity protein-like surface antigen
MVTPVSPFRGEKEMKRIALVLILAMVVASPALFAQTTDQTTTTSTTTTTQGPDQTTTTTRQSYDTDNDREHGEIGVFLDYLRLHHADLNQYGIGGRLGFNVHPNAQIELEGAYDFRQSKTATATDVTTGVTSTYRADLRTMSFLAGPKFHTNGPVRVFLTLKGGILNFNVSTPSAPLGFTGTLGTLKDGDNNGVFYPAAGIEMFAKWFGIRVEGGDMMYFDRGANHNFRLTAGPQFRF